MRIGQFALGLLLCIGTVLTMSAPNASGFMNHELARILFWHLPCALTCTFFYCAVPWFSYKFLKTRQMHWDIRAVSAMEIGLLMGLLTLVTGILFSYVQWGDFWNWDPRQTSFLLVLLIVGAYFALRGAITDAEKRAANSAVYSLAGILPLLFLIFVFPRVLESLHPSTTLISSKGLDPVYKSIFYSMLALMLTLCVWLYKLRVRAGLIEEAIENANAELGSSGDPTPTGVVRPVSLPTDH